MMCQVKDRLLSIILIILLVAAGSCKKFIEVPEPEDQILSSDVFSNEESAVSAVTGLYWQLMRTATNFSNAGASIYTGLSSDEIYNTAPNTDLDLLVTNSLHESMALLYSNFWIAAYKNIYHANAIIEGLAASTTIGAAAKSKLIAETKFIRAFIYFNLVNIYGDVPLILSSDYRLSAVKPRTTVQEVYVQIIDDLSEARNGLPAEYPLSGRTRANKWAAASLQARVYLYNGMWAEAEADASAIINSGMYSIVADPNNVFLSTSNEVVLQFYPVINSANTSQGAQFIPSSANVRPTYSITSHLLNAFESGDTRKTKWIKQVIVGGQSYSYPYKYKIRSGSVITENNIVFRLAELYLIRAEARVQLNMTDEAKSDLNVVRNRASLGNTVANDKNSLLAAIEQERRIELFTEWGHRWFDLKRTNRVDFVLSLIKGNNWQSTDVLYPIHEEELKRNPFLIQNPGY